MKNNQLNEVAIALCRVSRTRNTSKILQQQECEINNKADNIGLKISKTWKIVTQNRLNDKEFLLTLLEVTDYCERNRNIKYLIVSDLKVISRSVRNFQEISSMLRKLDVSIIYCEKPNFYIISKNTSHAFQRYIYIS